MADFDSTFVDWLLGRPTNLGPVTGPDVSPLGPQITGPNPSMTVEPWNPNEGMTVEQLPPNPSMTVEPLPRDLAPTEPTPFHGQWVRGPGRDRFGLRPGRAGAGAPSSPPPWESPAFQGAPEALQPGTPESFNPNPSMTVEPLPPPPVVPTGPGPWRNGYVPGEMMAGMPALEAAPDPGVLAPGEPQPQGMDAMQAAGPVDPLMDEYERAILAGSAAEQAANTQRAKGLADQQTRDASERAKVEADLLEIRARADKQSAEIRADIQALGQTRINPNRVWHDATTGQKIGALIALAIGGLAENKQTQGTTLKVLDGIIRRDVDAQIQDLQTRRVAITEAQRMMQDDLNRGLSLADARFKAIAWKSEQALKLLEANIMAGPGNEMSKANAAQAIALKRMEREQMMMQAEAERRKLAFEQYEKQAALTYTSPLTGEPVGIALDAPSLHEAQKFSNEHAIVIQSAREYLDTVRKYEHDKPRLAGPAISARGQEVQAKYAKLFSDVRKWSQSGAHLAPVEVDRIIVPLAPKPQGAYWGFTNPEGGINAAIDSFTNSYNLGMRGFFRHGTYRPVAPQTFKDFDGARGAAADPNGAGAKPAQTGTALPKPAYDARGFKLPEAPPTTAPAPARTSIRVEESTKTSGAMPRYDRATKATQGAAPGTVELRDELVRQFGDHKTGIHNNRNIRGSNKLSLHAEGRAIDMHVDREKGDAVAQWALANAPRYGVQEIIWNRRIWSSARAKEGWRKYTGADPHTDHVHIGQNRDGARLNG